MASFPGLLLTLQFCLWGSSSWAGKATHHCNSPCRKEFTWFRALPVKGATLWQANSEGQNLSLYKSPFWASNIQADKPGIYQEFPRCETTLGAKFPIFQVNWRLRTHTLWRFKQLPPHHISQQMEAEQGAEGVEKASHQPLCWMFLYVPLSP